MNRRMVVGRGERLGVAGNRLLHQSLLLVVDLPLHSVRQHLRRVSTLLHGSPHLYYTIYRFYYTVFKTLTKWVYVM